ncbi:MAG: hypothetical protein IJX08_07380, partial [Clostridia bacterium]|nr:hypothetical protein [Clostridia bacterium]
FYEQWDRYVKLGLAGKLPEGTVEVSHSSGDSAKGNGWAILYLDSQFKTGQTITVKVTGSKYVAVSLNERQGEALLYVPNGTFTFKIPADLATSYNVTMRGSGSVTFYRNPTIMVRIPTADELAEERNLAVNAYDLNATDTGAFPHASAATNTSGTAAPHCAIDGFVSNKSSGAWPYQAWLPAATDKNAALTIDFGREVVANTLKIKMRASSNDTHAINAVVTFSDGSTMELNMWDTAEFMTFDLGGKTITKLTIGNFTKAVENGAIAITEVQVIGTEK